MVTCSHEIKRHFLLGRKTMTNLDNILKSRDIILPTKVSLVTPGSQIWMWELDKKDSWALKNWCYGLWYCRRLLRVPWTERKSNQSILNEISPEYSLQGLMMRLKLQYFGHLMRRADSLEKTLMLEKIEGRQEMKGTPKDEMVGWHHWLNEHEFEHALEYGEGHGSLVCCSPWGCKVRHDWVTELNFLLSG